MKDFITRENVLGVKSGCCGDGEGFCPFVCGLLKNSWPRLKAHLKIIIAAVARGGSSDGGCGRLH